MLDDTLRKNIIKTALIGLRVVFLRLAHHSSSTTLSYRRLWIHRSAYHDNPPYSKAWASGLDRISPTNNIPRLVMVLTRQSAHPLKDIILGYLYGHSKK